MRVDHQSRMQPDVIVRLPQGKDVVIDAKMSLIAYERYFNGEDEAEREAALSEHIASLRGTSACWAARTISSCRGCARWTMC